MNVQPPTTSAAIAGTSHAAAKGGEADRQAADLGRRVSQAEQPGGRAEEPTAIDAGEQTQDRGGNGREAYDRFESSRGSDGQDQEEQTALDDEETAAQNPADFATAQDPNAATHLDFMA